MLGRVVITTSREQAAFRQGSSACSSPPAFRPSVSTTCATLLLAQGVDARTIMETLGHSQVSLTLNTYSHVLPTVQRAAADKLNAVLA